VTPTATSLAEAVHRADVLVEALPFIRRFAGNIIVIKLGGSAIDAGSGESVLRDVVLLSSVGIRPVIVHGGGPEISAWQQRLGLETRFINGLRVTDEATMELARMVLTGKIGPELVAGIHRLGGSAIGLSGEDGPIMWARTHGPDGNADLGYVADVGAVDPGPIHSILDGGRIPVIASVLLGRDGHCYNVNADTAAAELAVALEAKKLILLTDVAGVRGGDGSLISSLDAAHTRELLGNATIGGGMIPKVRAALRAVDAGTAAHIIDGRVQHALLLELLTESGIGTMLRGPSEGDAA